MPHIVSLHSRRTEGRHPRELDAVVDDPEDLPIGEVGLLAQVGRSWASSLSRPVRAPRPGLRGTLHTCRRIRGSRRGARRSRWAESPPPRRCEPPRSGPRSALSKPEGERVVTARCGHVVDAGEEHDEREDDESRERTQDRPGDHRALPHPYLHASMAGMYRRPRRRAAESAPGVVAARFMGAGRRRKHAAGRGAAVGAGAGVVLDRRRLDSGALAGMLQERADFPKEEAEEDARGPRSGRVVQTSRGSRSSSPRAGVASTRRGTCTRTAPYELDRGRPATTDALRLDPRESTPCPIR